MARVSQAPPMQVLYVAGSSLDTDRVIVATQVCTSSCHTD